VGLTTTVRLGSDAAPWKLPLDAFSCGRDARPVEVANALHGMSRLAATRMMQCV
jgi:hypothetical protein